MGPEDLAAVLVGDGRAWPGFEPTRRAEGSRRGRRAGGPPPSGTESSYVRALRNRDRFAAALGHGKQSGSGGGVATGVPRGPS